MSNASVGTGRDHTNEIRRLSTLLEVSQALSGVLNLKAALQSVLDLLERRHQVTAGPSAGDQHPLPGPPVTLTARGHRAAFCLESDRARSSRPSRSFPSSRPSRLAGAGLPLSRPMLIRMPVPSREMT